MAKIAIIDDSPTQIYGAKALLERKGHEVITAEDGEQGVTLVKDQMPDIVLMDVVMPNMNGFQATRSLTRDDDTKHIPVVLISTKNQETDRVWGMRQGARGYLVKPLRETDLLRTINELLSENTTESDQ